MELTKKYDGVRREVVYGSYAGLEKRAVELVYACLKRFVPYVAECVAKPTGKAYPIFVGTRESNAYLPETPELAPDDSYYRVRENEIVISGGSPEAVYYAAVSFCDDYLPSLRRRKAGHPFFITPFVDKTEDAEWLARPSVAERGLWTWGHVIYDYRKYIENMARLKLNRVTVWNDFAPVNAAEFVSYAHSYGIKVIFGYSWGWDEKPDVNSDEQMRQWGDKAVSSYLNDYAPTGADGIYFQLFTESKEERIGDTLIADAAVRWVNYISALCFDAAPDISIEFGLHATSVKNHLDVIAKTDERVSIVWEDCGDFPYHYDASHMADNATTSEFTRRIASLRGGKGFGAVLKGVSWLDWSSFAHQTGPSLIGVSDEAEIEEKLPVRRDAMRYQKSYWLKNGAYALEIIRIIAKSTNGKAKLEDLVEDGMFERLIPLPVALFAEMCFDTSSSFDTILSKVSRRTYID